MSDAHRHRDQFKLRLPDGLRDRIEVAAAKQDRSMSAEIIRALGKAFPKSDEETVAEAWDALIADGWTPPQRPTNAISRILGKKL